MNELLQMNFGKTPLDSLNLPPGLFLLRQGGWTAALWSLGGMVITLRSPSLSLSLSCFPLLLAQCICFQAGLTQAWDIPCCGPLKPETLEVDVCLRPVCCQTPRQVLQMWPSAPRHSGRRPVALSCPLPPTPWPSNHHHRGPGQAAHWQTREQTTLGWSATPAYTCHKT